MFGSKNSMIGWSIGEPADAPSDVSTNGASVGLATQEMNPKLDRFAPPFRNEAHGRHQSGFTVVELLITMAIMLTIAAMAVPSLFAAVNLAKVARAVGDIRTMETEIVEYDIENGQLPDTLADIGRANFSDPWHYPYEYLNHATMKGNGKARKDRFLVPLNSDYDLYSVGHDGQTAAPITAQKSQDDVIRASDGSYVGLASQF